MTSASRPRRDRPRTGRGAIHEPNPTDVSNGGRRNHDAPSLRGRRSPTKQPGAKRVTPARHATRAFRRHAARHDGHGEPHRATRLLRRYGPRNDRNRDCFVIVLLAMTASVRRHPSIRRVAWVLNRSHVPDRERVATDELYILNHSGLRTVHRPCGVPAAQRVARRAHECASRDQSKCGPGSVLRPGATSQWPASPEIG